MKTYKKLHESKEVANIHIAKIKERGGNVKQSVQNGKILLEYSFPNENIWYHGSDKQMTELKVSQQLKLDYKTEDGAWFTSDKHQAGFYGKYIYQFDCSNLKILDKSKMNKMDFVVDFWVNKMKKDKKTILNSIKLNDEFKDLYDYAFMTEVEDKGFDAVKLRGEFEKGNDLWLGYDAVKKIRMVS
jgi:vacuolar-type H+-ATPase subunit C/Vma6